MCFVVHSKERGHKNKLTHSSLPGLVHIIIQLQKRGKKNYFDVLSIQSQWLKWTCGGNNMIKSE